MSMGERMPEVQHQEAIECWKEFEAKADERCRQLSGEIDRLTAENKALRQLLAYDSVLDLDGPRERWIRTKP